MNANFVYLCYVALILGLFNFIFIGGFFKTAYKFSKPFISFIIISFLVIGFGEVLFHIPYFSELNAFGFNHLGLQLIILLIGIGLYILLIFYSMRKSIKNFERIDI